MGADEVVMVETLKEYRLAKRRLIERHKGRVVNAPMILCALSVVEMALATLAIAHGKGGAQAAIDSLAQAVPG
jgi:alanine-glyoxylate transaminase/serine-glyoxylate transaminase/serine-pyruvate transaminase